MDRVFHEPYETDSWRVEAVYRDVLPRLCALARASGKTVALKLHPFESARQRRRLLKRMLSAEDHKFVSVTDAPLSRAMLEKTWCAVTVESTVAFECAAGRDPGVSVRMVAARLRRICSPICALRCGADARMSG